MKTNNLLAIVALWAVLICPAVVRSETAAGAFAKGRAMLELADFRGALKAFATAARADRQNRQYLDHYSQLRQIIILRHRLAKEQNTNGWQEQAKTLHAFYVRNGIHTELLALDKQTHARLGTADSAAQLAQTQLAMKLNEQALDVLKAVPPTKQTMTTQTLMGIALVQQKKLAEARRLAAAIKIPDGTNPSKVYPLTRLHAAIGDSEYALELLTWCLTYLPPKMADTFKAHAKACPEFAALAGTKQFARVLKTESKIADDDFECPGGGCANCPMRADCGYAD